MKGTIRINRMKWTEEVMRKQKLYSVSITCGGVLGHNGKEEEINEDERGSERGVTIMQG